MLSKIVSRGTLSSGLLIALRNECRARVLRGPFVDVVAAACCRLGAAGHKRPVAVSMLDSEKTCRGSERFPSCGLDATAGLGDVHDLPRM